MFGWFTDSDVQQGSDVTRTPYLAQQDVLDFCSEKGIHITAHCPTGNYFSLSDESGCLMVILRARPREPGLQW